MCPKCGFTGKPFKTEQFVLCPRCRTVIPRKGAEPIDWPDALLCPNCNELGEMHPASPRAYSCAKCNLVWDTDTKYKCRAPKLKMEELTPQDVLSDKELKRLSQFKSAFGPWYTDHPTADNDTQLWKELMDGDTHPQS